MPTTRSSTDSTRHVWEAHGDDHRLEGRLAAWTAAGLISQDQASRLRDAERDARVSHERARSSLVPEALGYLGGVVVVVGAGLLADQLWADLSTGWRLAVLGTAAAALGLSGAFVPAGAGAAATRLRAVLWAACVVLTALLTAVLTDQALGLHERPAAMTTAATAAAVAAALWWPRPTILQQAVTMVALAITAATLVVLVDPDSQVGGLGPWTVGVVWLLLGWGEVLRPSRPAVVLGAVGAVAGGISTVGTDGGTVLALVTAGALVLLALRLRDLAVLVVGAAGMLLVLPMAVQDWFGGSLAAPVALMLSGGGLIAAGLWIARSGREGRGWTR